MLKTAPAVFAVGSEYQIMVPVEREVLFWVEIDGEAYFDESNGIMNSLCGIHRVCVPMAVLDAAGGYTVCLRPVTDRLPYFPVTEDPLRFPFSFRPVPETGARLYVIADAHNTVAEPIAAAKACGKIDLLVLNGDVIDHSGDPDKFGNIYEICSAVTGGGFPVVFARGNHDMRGRYAEKFAEYTPNHLGRTFYSFRLGSIWGLVLDCGEDKPDDHPEYGFTVACHAFRRRQTAYLKQLIADAGREYAAEGVRTRLVICHTPFTWRFPAPFDIEEDVFREWSALLREHIRPDLMLCAHLHQALLSPPGGEMDTYGQPCPVILTSRPTEDSYDGCCIVLTGDGAELTFADSRGVRTPLGTVSFRRS